MARKLLFGHGENLISDLPRPSLGGGPKHHPYADKGEVLARLLPQVSDMSNTVMALPDLFCPKGYSVFKLVLHPAYTAKSWFPHKLLRAFDFRVVGSKYVRIVAGGDAPQFRVAGDDGKIKPVLALELFVAGHRKNISRFSRSIDADDLFSEIRKIERISAFANGDRIIGTSEELRDVRVFELVLHASRYEDSIVSAFVDVANASGVEAMVDKRMHSSRLCFMPIKATNIEKIRAVEGFSFIRLVRKMPNLRDITRDCISGSATFAMSPLPPVSPIEGRVAVFDIGCETDACMNGWVRPHHLDHSFVRNNGPLHGTLVNSALLFGDIETGTTLKPVAPIDSYQVVDPADHSSGLELYEALDRICDILDADNHEFANLSIGPDLPISDDEVHAWTTRLDEKLSSGKVLMTVAVGNNGEMDEVSGNARIEVPGDAVNVLSVGASTKPGESSGWDRAPYSALGPGRMPGKIKPEVLDFGGSDDRAFGLFDPVDKRRVEAMGTSFAAPNALRKCVLLRKKYPELKPLALKALLVHFAIRKDVGHDENKHGHGALSSETDKFVVCDDNEMSIVYQGNLDPQKYIKVPIPVSENLTGRIRLKVTLCYATGVNAESPGNYTKSAIEVLLRPDVDNMTKDPMRPKAKPFFDAKKYATEDELRREGLKWSTVMTGEKVFDAERTIEEPFLELHYVARDGVERDDDAQTIPYAMVITIIAPKTPDIYERVLQRYATKIRPIMEQEIQVPVEV